MAKKGKKYTEARKKIDRDRRYELVEAIDLVKESACAKFDETTEVAIRLGVDPRKADQMVRGTVMMPHGTGKSVRVLVFAKGEKELEARDAGADFVGADDLVEKIQGGWLEFDKAVATPDMMGLVGRIAKILGPRGMMPNPKVGTVTVNIKETISEIKKGKVEFRTDKQSGMHLAVGKISFSEDKILENASRVIEAVNEAKPAGVKGKFIKSLFIATSMNPGLKLES